jgi:bifunctional DNA-binding transcriptional regulator/antitoxin component of YhaV-PrlF toxin-antitoxin module
MTELRLEGKDLLAKLKECSELTKREAAIECGFFSETNGKVRMNLPDFQEAILLAKGIVFQSSAKNGRGRGVKANYQATVHKNGQILIGATYVKELGYKEGDVFDIKLGSKNIRLIPVNILSGDNEVFDDSVDDSIIPVEIDADALSDNTDLYNGENISTIDNSDGIG